ncbi:MAG: VacJ family lipoprotein [Gammaproteobacteria bacterium]|nr:MAG: VacJ family lipoprotein [Gammaproteobacteria bacterium]RLA61823.1 MAG: VacJ family lipoprotein [Gammaproteobacteria bacterium]
MALSRYILIFVLTFPVASAWGLEQQSDIDPWESMNRRVFSFNETLDKYLLKPVARGYRFIMPDPAERGVTKFIANIYEFNTIINSLLQGRPGNALHTSGRFVVNTTVGLLGFFDVASHMELDHRPADFGQTLAVWGVGSGPFFMAPLIGPRTIRSLTGYFVDTYSSIPALQNDTELAYIFWTIEVIDIRARLLKAEDLITGDRYIFIRDAYLQHRKSFINNGVVEDSFSDFEEEEDWEEF